jgi:hypothetical protein
MAKKSRESGSSYTYFKQLFLKNPDWLKEKSNAVILARYRADHGLGEDAEVEKKVTNNLANLKSVMRKHLRKRGRPVGLEEVIHLLRRARNKVVWKMGEK